MVINKHRVYLYTHGGAGYLVHNELIILVLTHCATRTPSGLPAASA